MFFSCEYGVRSSPGEGLEPRFFNPKSALGSILSAIKAQALPEMVALVQEKIEEQKRLVAEVDQTLSTITDAKAKAAQEADKKLKQSNITRLEEFSTKLKSITSIDLSYTDKADDRMNLVNQPISTIGSTVIAPMSRTYLIGMIDKEAMALCFDVNIPLSTK